MCPKLAIYDAYQQKKALDELERLPADSMLAVMIEEYGDLRARCRALEK